MARIIPLTTASLTRYFPRDLRNRGVSGDVAYTLSNPEAFGVDVPVYRDRSHLAAWLAGYAAYNNHIIDQHTAEKEN